MLQNKSQHIEHNGIGDINLNSTVNHNDYYAPVTNTSIESITINAVQQAIPESFSRAERDYILYQLNEIRESVGQPKNRNRLQAALEKLKPFAVGVMAATSFAGSVSDLITFFTK